MNKALPIMIQGTHSDAGKSVIVTALCRIFSQKGYRTAPFKSQNMALNSYITLDGKEIGRAQGVQAEAAGVIATTDMNPILIKPTRENESQIVVHGQPYQNMKAMSYRQDFFQLGLDIISQAYTNLSNNYEVIVIEGAGSPAEINLNDRELVNMRMARIANAPVILVGDIDRGGVFASLVGTLQLLEEEDRARVIGVLINKFRGDISLLEPGLKWFEEYTGKPVLGVLPFIPGLNIDAEDSLILQQYSAEKDSSKEIDIAVIQYPMISNFTDIDPFFMEPDCHVRFVRQLKELGQPDIIILPGSKNTIEDMLYLQKTGLAAQIVQLVESKATLLIGVCGGYQMLGIKIEDPYEVESPLQETDGLGLLPVRTILSQDKKTVRAEGTLHFLDQQLPVTGYEIHMGLTELVEESIDFTNSKQKHSALHPLIQREETGNDGYMDQENQVIGTYFHGIFHNDHFRAILLNQIRANRGLPAIETRPCYQRLREEGFDRLAREVEKHIQVDKILESMKDFSNMKDDCK